MTLPLANHCFDGPPDAPVVVLSGSLGSTLSVWDTIVRELSPSFRVLRYDHPGHDAAPVTPGSRTMADLGQSVLALLDSEGIERAHFCGTSLGGMVGMWLAVNAPARVDRLAVVCTSAHLPPADGWHERARVVRAQGTQAIARTVVARWFTPEFSRTSPEIIATMVDMVSACNAEGYASCCEAIASWNVLDEIHRIGAPTLVVAARDDEAIPPAHAYQIAARVPNANVVILDDAAHLACVERASRVAELLRRHLGDYRPGAARGEINRRAVLGDAHVDNSQARATDFTAPFQDFITRYAWGEIWERPGLSRAERSIVTLSVLAARQSEHELEMHVAAAVRNGLTPEQIREIFLHLSIYAGVPAANRAFSIAERVLRRSREPDATKGKNR